jgi:ketosteroid isomerase-like protein
MYCPAPECPHAQRTGEPAEYRDGITQCQDCGSPLVEARPEAEPATYERFVPVFEVPNAGLLPFVKSLLQSSGMRFFIKGIGSGLDFVSGPVRVYVEPDRADEARELLEGVGEESEVDGELMAPRSVAGALAEIEARLALAWVARDRAFLEEILSDDWAVVDATGGIRSKKEVIEEAFETSRLRVDSARIEEVAVRLFGDTAVVRGRSEVAGSYNGESMAVSLRFTDVFLRRNRRWLCIASHASPISN